MRNEPAITLMMATGLVGALMGLLQVFGVVVSDEQSGAILKIIDAGWPFLMLIPGAAGYLVVRSQVLGPETAREHGIDPRTGKRFSRDRMNTPRDGRGPLGALLTLVALLACIPAGLSGCGAIPPAVVAAALPVVFDVIATAEAAVNTFQAWANRFKGAPGVTDQFLASVNQSADEAKAAFLEARELMRQGVEAEQAVREIAKQLKDQAVAAANRGLAAFDAMREAFRSVGLFRGERLVHPPDGRALGPDELQVELPPKRI